MTPDLLFLSRFLLALCIWREARGESLRGKQLVADVIRNRMNDPRWPGTYPAVILQPRQFSAFNLGDPNSVKFPESTDPTWHDCLSVTDALLADALLADAPSLTTANSYHVEGLFPVWADRDKIVAHEGHHVFYAL